MSLDVSAREIDVNDCPLESAEIKRLVELTVDPTLRPDASVDLTCEKNLLEIVVNDPSLIAKRVVGFPTAAPDRTAATIIAELLRTPGIEREPIPELKNETDVFAMGTLRSFSGFFGFGATIGAVFFANRLLFVSPFVNFLVGNRGLDTLQIRHTEYVFGLTVGVQDHIRDLTLRFGLGPSVGLFRMAPVLNPDERGLATEVNFVLRSIHAEAGLSWLATERLSLMLGMRVGWMPATIRARIEPTEETVDVHGIWYSSSVGLGIRL